MRRCGGAEASKCVEVRRGPAGQRGREADEQRGEVQRCSGPEGRRGAEVQRCRGAGGRSACSPMITLCIVSTGFQSSRRMLRQTCPSMSMFGWKTVVSHCTFGGSCG